MTAIVAHDLKFYDLLPRLFSGDVTRFDLVLSSEPFSLAAVDTTYTASQPGVGLIDPFTQLSGLFPGVTIRPLTPVLEIRPRFVFPPNRPLSIAATEFIQVVRDTFAQSIKNSPLIFEL